MAMRAQKDAWHQLTVAHFAGNPVYFFDTRFLLANVAALAGWNPARLEAAIAPRVENALTEADACFSTEGGFYVVFGRPTVPHARNKAHEICRDILQHFYGRGNFLKEHIEKFCRPSSVQQLVNELGVSPPAAVKRRALRPRRAVAAVKDVLEPEKTDLARVLIALFTEYLNSNWDGGDYVFTPGWDNKKQSITCFSCDLAPEAKGWQHSRSSGLDAAIEHCERDVIALAAAVRGVRHVRARDDFAVITVPVHAETLAWAKTRQAYFSVLSKIEPQSLALLAPRIVGLGPGANPALVAEWISSLHRYAQRTFVHFNSVFDFMGTQVLGASGFGMTISQTMRMPRSLYDSLVSQATKLQRLCNHQNAIPYAHDIVTLPEMYLLRAHGVRIMIGPVIGEPEPLPGPTGPLPFNAVGRYSTDVVYLSMQEASGPPGVRILH